MISLYLCQSRLDGQIDEHFTISANFTGLIIDYGKCSKISNTTKYIFFPAVRNFRNRVSEKVLVFEILECGLYHKQKQYICMSNTAI